MTEFFITFLYQPFLNILVGFYWLIGHTPLGYDMGVAVILLTILIRLLLLPLTISGHKSEAERRAIEERMQEVERMYSHDPVALRREAKKVMRSNRLVLIAEGISFSIQVAIALILWRIFATGLIGEDLHLLYGWMPKLTQPFNLSFLGKFDLTHSHLLLNIIQSLLIFVLETVIVLTSPYHYSRAEVIRVQLVLPVVSFIVFAFLPAGKKLFVITTLTFSLLVVIIRALADWWQRTFPAPVEEEAPPEEPPAETPPPATPTPSEPPPGSRDVGSVG